MILRHQNCTDFNRTSGHLKRWWFNWRSWPSGNSLTKRPSQGDVPHGWTHSLREPFAPPRMMIIPLFTTGFNHPRWLFGILSINSTYRLEYGGKWFVEYVWLWVLILGSKLLNLIIYGGVNPFEKYYCSQIGSSLQVGMKITNI